MAEPPLLTLQDIRLTFGGTALLEGIDLQVGPRDRICLIGRNGSGKSTVLKIASGGVVADSGVRFLQPSATLRYLPQEPDPVGFSTSRAFALAGLGPGDDPHQVDALLTSLGLTGEEDPARLSGGELRRAAIVQALAAEPDILLLDEPTNHLDLPGIEWLEERLRSHRGALVFVSHDRRFLEALSSATVWIDRGRTRRLDKGFGAFEAWRDAVLEEEEIAGHKVDRKLAREADWLRYGVSGRRKRNVRRLGDLHALRAERKQMLSRGPVGQAALTTEAGPKSGRLVIEARHVAKSYGGRPIVQDVSIRIARGDRLGIIGPNGAGKTTLVNLLTGRLEPDSGSVKLGANVEMVTLDQTRESLDPQTSLSDTLTEGRGDSVQVGSSQRHVIGYMRDFLFLPEQAGTPVERLSGGERGRLMLARALAKRSNLMVLDEPTNDLDLETLDLLQDLLADYDGTLILISHDRDFIDRIVGSVLMADGDGRWTEYAGGYSDMMMQRGERPDARAAEPARAKETAAARAKAPARKLSFKDQHALTAIPATIAKLTKEAERLEAQLADPQLYVRDPAAFSRTSDALATARGAIATAEEEWLRLEMLREELESG